MSRAAWPEKVNASMFATLAKKLFGSSNDRTLKQFQKRVPAINAHEADTARLSDAELAARTAAFRQRVANGESLDDLLPEAFATVREAARRVLGQRRHGLQQGSGKQARRKVGGGQGLTHGEPVPYVEAAIWPKRPT